MTVDQGPVKVSIKYLPHYSGLPPLKRMTAGSSGYDVRAACPEPMTIEPGKAALVPAGFVLSIPEGFEAQVRPRSGMALKHQLGILNSPGTIDSDYRGEVRIILFNFGREDFQLRRGERIAQIVFCPLPAVELVELKELDATGRGSGGFGHTG
ncbi:MAG: dUTP diphosphatase [Candidatus Krumholzibacteriota bacterium]|nr:dUTP diphosphatase [Candidatus Krumholzibacteriota bacterium]